MLCNLIYLCDVFKIIFLNRVPRLPKTSTSVHDTHKVKKLSPSSPQPRIYAEGGGKCGES